MRGMVRSVTTRSGSSSCAFNRPSRPFSAWAHTQKSASRVKSSQITLRTAGLSSTTNTDHKTHPPNTATGFEMRNDETPVDSDSGRRLVLQSPFLAVQQFVELFDQF